MATFTLHQGGIGQSIEPEDARVAAWTYVVEATDRALDTPGLTDKDRSDFAAIQRAACEITGQPVVRPAVEHPTEVARRALLTAALVEADTAWSRRLREFADLLPSRRRTGAS